MIDTLKLENGKYECILRDNYPSEVLRYGEKWRNLTGDNFVACLVQEILSLREKCVTLREELQEFKDDEDLINTAIAMAHEENPMGCLDKAEFDGDGVKVVCFSNSMDYSAGRNYRWYSFKELRNNNEQI